MSFGEESDAQKVKFKEQLLNAGPGDNPSDQLMGVELAAPQADPQLPGARSAARGVETATGQQASQRRLRPRHRDVVRDYFDRTDQSGKTNPVVPPAGDPSPQDKGAPATDESREDSQGGSASQATGP